MAANTTPTVPKTPVQTPKSKKLTREFIKPSAKHLWIFIGIFAVIGGYFIFRSFAAPTNSDTSGPSINDNTIGVGDRQFNYQGVWDYTTGISTYKGDQHASQLKDDYYQVRFSGVAAKLYITEGPNSGVAAVSVDGGSENEIDTYSQTQASQVLVYTTPPLTNGTHTLKVRVTGAKNANSSGVYVAADRVDVMTATPPGQ